MDIKRLSELYGNFEYFVESFTSVRKEVEKGVLDGGEDLTTYHVTFNEHEFMSFSELCELVDFIKSYLKLNGVDTSKIEGGRDNRSIDWTDTYLE